MKMRNKHQNHISHHVQHGKYLQVQVSKYELDHSALVRKPELVIQSFKCAC